MAIFHLALLPLLAVTAMDQEKQAPVNDADVFSWGEFPDKCLDGSRHLVSF